MRGCRVGLWLSGLLLGCGGAGVDDDSTGADDDSTVAADDDDTPAPPSDGLLEATNSAGRHGSYYLPGGWNLEPLPLAVLFHATGGDGASISGQFATLAVTDRFAIVAPDSRESPGGDFTWEVGTDPGERTPDIDFALECLDEVLAMGVIVDGSRVLSAGHSGGGSMAPYVATNEGVFTHFAVLHGGVFADAFGDNAIPGWFSTGTDDTVRPPALVQEAMAEAEASGLTELEYHEYPGEHGLSEAEKHDVIFWWLGL